MAERICEVQIDRLTGPVMRTWNGVVYVIHTFHSLGLSSFDPGIRRFSYLLNWSVARHHW
jgi:hypothetical protein